MLISVYLRSVIFAIYLPHIGILHGPTRVGRVDRRAGQRRITTRYCKISKIKRFYSRSRLISRGTLSDIGRRLLISARAYDLADIAASLRDTMLTAPPVDAAAWSFWSTPYIIIRLWMYDPYGRLHRVSIITPVLSSVTNIFSPQNQGGGGLQMTL